MNKTHFEHIVYAVLMQLPFGLFGYWWLGAAFAIGFFIGREHAQAEERYIEANGGRRYHTPVAPEWAVFNLKWWDRDALLDWITPTTAVVAVALLSTHW